MYFCLLFTLLFYLSFGLHSCLVVFAPIGCTFGIIVLNRLQIVGTYSHPRRRNPSHWPPADSSSYAPAVPIAGCQPAFRASRTTTIPARFRGSDAKRAAHSLR